MVFLMEATVREENHFKDLVEYHMGRKPFKSTFFIALED